MKNINNPFEFKSYDNPTWIIINLDNQETLVEISYKSSKNGIIFTLDFSYKSKHYKKNIEPVSNPQHLWNSADISFDNIELNNFEKSKIADCLNKIFNYIFD